MAEREVLWGADYPNVGEVGLKSVGEHAAVALSYGGEPKHWPSKTPNEDAVAAVAGARSTLLVVADGHEGYESVPASVGLILDRIGHDPPPADLSDGDLVDLFVEANEMALAAIGGGRTGPATESRTTLVMALIAGPLVQWASFGDSEIFLASANDAQSLGTPRLKFISYPMSRRDVAEHLDRGRDELDDTSWVIVASDGLTDYLGGHGVAASRVIPEIIEAGRDPVAVAEALVLGAFEGGAGDNVGLAVARTASA